MPHEAPTHLEMSELIISRTWAMPSPWTFTIPPIKRLLDRYCGDGSGWADPFAGRSYFCEFRNDLDRANQQPFQIEAQQFLAGINCALRGVIFDPPYSPTQAARVYKNTGAKRVGFENPTGGFPKCKDRIAQLVGTGGYAVSFGWNTVGMGRKRGFAIVEILIVCHGGNHHDTLCTVEVKM